MDGGIATRGDVEGGARIVGWSSFGCDGNVDAGLAMMRQFADITPPTVAAIEAGVQGGLPLFATRAFTEFGAPLVGLGKDDWGAALLFRVSKNDAWEVVGLGHFPRTSDPWHPAFLPETSGCSSDSETPDNICDTWVNLLDPQVHASLSRTLRDAYGDTRPLWATMHSVAANVERWAGDADYIGECNASKDADCDHWFDVNADGSPRDNCPFLWNPDQADANDDGWGDKCDGDGGIERIQCTGAAPTFHLTSGIAERWRNGGAVTLGCPTGDVQFTTGAWSAPFAHGEILQVHPRGMLPTPEFDRVVVLRNFAGQWQRLGIPTGDENANDAGADVYVESGYHWYWSLPFGFHKLNAAGALEARFRQIGGPKSSWPGPLIGDEETLAGGWRARVRDVDLYAPYGQPVYSIEGAIRAAYNDRGTSSGALGYPTSDVSCSTLAGVFGCLSTFAGGDIYWSDRQGAVVIDSPFVVAAFERCGGIGTYGWPLGYDTSGRAAFIRRADYDLRIGLDNGLCAGVAHGSAH